MPGAWTIQLAAALSLAAAVPVFAQTIETESLLAALLADARYDSASGKLSATLVCKARAPLVSWALVAQSVYADGRRGYASILRDDPQNPENHCEGGQTRAVELRIAREKSGAALLSVLLRVAALVDAERNTAGDDGMVREVARLRAEQLGAARKWREELEALLAAPDPGAAIRALREWKMTQPVGGGQVERLVELERQIDWPGNSPATVLQRAYDQAARAEEVYAQARLER